ncbi:MAG: LPS assembly lipoprotein LptE [Bacteroidales bacterium]|nr:LPS assembly lipoprotein LptE [Bacteroidales bacterium]
MKGNRYIRQALALVVVLLSMPIFHSCGIYSFSGTSIQPGIRTVSIDLFEYKALRVNPTLASEMTEGIKDKFRKMTKLEQVDMDGDLEIVGSITGYDVRATAVTSGEVAAQNRLTVSISIKYTNRRYPDEDFEKSFSAYADYPSEQSLDSVESSLCEEIVEQLCEQVLNATVANW